MISYTVELSDGGFIRPPTEIVPTGEEVLPSHIRQSKFTHTYLKGYAVIMTMAKFVAAGKADADKMKWRDPKLPPATTTTTPPPPQPTGDGTTLSTSPGFSTADMLTVFVVIFVAVVGITAIAVAVNQYYPCRRRQPFDLEGDSEASWTYRPQSQAEEGGDGKDEVELKEVENKGI